MRKTIILLAILSVAFSSAAALLPTRNGDDEKFQKSVEAYLDEHWKFYPTAATLAGYHAYDSKLEDFSDKNLEKRHDALDGYNQEFVAKIDKTRLSPELQIDHDIIRDAIDFELFRHENLVPWEYNPLIYNEIFIDSIRGLLASESAPLEARAKNAVERMKALPKFIKQAKSNLKTPPQLHTETAIKQFPGILDFYRNEFPKLIEAAPADSRSRLQSGLPAVISALQDYQNFLQKELLPKSTGNFRLGPTAHSRLLRLMLQNDIPLQELLNRAPTDYRNLRREMFFTSVPFYKIMDPKIDLENPPAGITEDQLYNAVVSHVLNRIKREHAGRDEFIDRVRESAEEIKNFIIQNQLIEIPEVNFVIQPMPPDSRGITWSRTLFPGIYATSKDVPVEICPIPQEWDEEKSKSFLEEYNNSFLYFWAVRNVYPGQLVPLAMARKNHSLARNIYPNQALIKSWPVLVEEMLVKSGFENYDLKLRLNQLKNLLKAVIDFLLEFNIHQGGMAKEQAIQYMTAGGFQTRAEAEMNWNRIVLKPGDAALAYAGYLEILKMEEAQKEFEGESFSQKEFLQKLLSHGAMPLRHLKKKMTEK